MTENLKKFLEAVSHNAETAEKVNSMTQPEIIALVRELGIVLTGADFVKPDVQELDDDELVGVAGGEDISCSCAMGGGGTADNNDRNCACVVAGVGYREDGVSRCDCTMAGSGYDS